MLVRRIGSYKPTGEGLYQPTKAQRVKKNIKSGFSRLNEKLEKDRVAYKEQRKEELERWKEKKENILKKRVKFKKKETDSIRSFRKDTAKGIYGFFGLRLKKKGKDKK